MSKLKLPITESMIAFGCIGASEIIITSFFWHQIMSNQNLELFRPGEPMAQLGVLGLLTGILGGFVFFFRTIINIFIEKKKIGRLATSLFAFFVVELFWVIYIGTGV